MTDQITYADAALSLSEQIARRYGPGADIADFDVQTLPCPIAGTDLSGFTILAKPQGQIATADNLCAAYYGPMHPNWPPQPNR